MIPTIITVIWHTVAWLQLRDLSAKRKSAYGLIMSEPTVDRMLCEGPVQFSFGQHVSIKYLFIDLCIRFYDHIICLWQLRHNS